MLFRPVAAIDVGTNSLHMIIARKNKDQIEILDREKVTVRLGEGGGDYDYITEEAQERAIQALKSFKAIANKYNALIHAVATSAVREAKNQADFLKRVFEETKIKIHVIPGQEEARLIYLGVLQAFPVYDKYTLVIDIGGGSTEIVVGFQGKPLFIRSLKLGAVRLTEKFFPGGLLSPAKIKKAKEYIQNFIIDVYQEYLEEKLHFDVAIGSSGTVRTIKELLNGENQMELESSRILELIEKILKYEDPEKRKKKLHIEEKRADILPAGSLILETIIEAFRIPKLLSSPFALREGILYELLFRKTKRTELRELRLNSCKNLLKKFHQEIPEKTANVAMKLAKQLGKFYPEILSHKELLEYAALLHNIGIAIAHNAHHKHSYYIITNTEYLLGFTEKELQFIGLVARYHRKSHPDKKTPELQSFSPLEQRLIAIYAGILRISIGLTRLATEPDVEIHMENQNCRIRVITENKEISRILSNMAQLRKELLEEQLGSNIFFEPVTYFEKHYAYSASASTL